MSLVIRWTQAKSANWTHSRVYRSDTKDGTYELLALVARGVYAYTDTSGTSSHWYKVSYWDGVNESSLSEPLIGNQDASYVRLSLFRSITNFGSHEITDTVVYSLATEASRIARNAVTTEVKLERQFKGSVDGTNTLMYTEKKPLGDYDFDSVVDANDVSVFYATKDAQNVLNYGTAQTVSAVDARAGRVTMATAPTGTTASEGVYITYRHTVENLDYDTLKMAATYMCAHLASLKIRGDTPNYRQISAPYLRKDVANIPPEGQEAYGYLKEYERYINEAMGHGDDGVGFSNVQAEAC